MAMNINPLIKGFSAAVKPPENVSPWEWCERHVVVDHNSPMPGRWRAYNSPWVVPVMAEWANPNVRTVVVRCSAQSSKTQTIINLVLWSIANDPGPMMWVMAAKDESEDFVGERARPAIVTCKPVAESLIEEKKLSMTFASMPLYFVGAGSKSKLQSKPIRYLIMDEVRNYRAGAVDLVSKRTTSFWNSKTGIVSTPDKKDDTVDRAFKDGDQRTLHFPCPSCGQLQPLKWEQMKWDTNDTTKPNGRWDIEAVAQTIRYECVSCGHKIRDTPHERRAIASQGRFVALNPSAPKTHVSFTWNAMLPTWVRWRTLVHEFLNARSALKGRSPDIEPMKAFVTERLAEPWEDELGFVDNSDHLRARCEDYSYGEAWSDMRVRFLTVDKQIDHYYWVVRAWGRTYGSRLVAYGRCNTEEDIHQIAKEYEVVAANVGIDAGFNQSDVLKAVSKTGRWISASAWNGWKPMKGDDSEYFVEREGDVSVRKLWRMVRMDPAFGTTMAGRVGTVPMIVFCTEPMKDILGSLVSGISQGWTLPKGIGRDYLKQMSSEQRVEHQDVRGRKTFRWEQRSRANHYWDCEVMQVGLAVVAKLLKGARQGNPSKSKESEGNTEEVGTIGPTK